MKTLHTATYLICLATLSVVTVLWAQSSRVAVRQLPIDNITAGQMLIVRGTGPGNKLLLAPLNVGANLVVVDNGDGTFTLDASTPPPVTPTRVYLEDLTGQVDGTNAVFTTVQPFDPATEEVLVNGLIVVEGTDYAVTGAQQITFATEGIPQPPETGNPSDPGDSVRVSYTLP